MKLRNKKKDFYIKVLQYGEKHQSDGFTISEIQRDLGLNQRELDLVQAEIAGSSGSSIFRRLGTQPQTNATLYTLTFEDKFKLLEYVELKEARKASLNAIIIAIIAIAISIFVGFYQIFTPAKVTIVEDLTQQESILPLKE